MKKYYILFLLPLLMSFASCGFDDEEAEFPVKKVLFTYQKYNRQLVVGEGLEMKVGVVFAGLPKSDRDRVVEYVIDPSLVTDSRQTVLPTDYYKFDDPSQIIIPKGQLKGYMPVRIDSAKFVNDPKALTGEYILPVRIVKADADAITEGKGYTLISVSYQGKQYGNYEYSGVRTNSATQEQQQYANVKTVTNSIRQLQTVGPDTFRVYADQQGTNDPAKGQYSFLITLPVKGSGQVTIAKDPDYLPGIEVEADGESTYDADTKTFVLCYKYTQNGVEWKTVDRMTFRNRIRDDQGDGRVLYEWRGF